jgi:hypothetical protein
MVLKQNLVSSSLSHQNIFSQKSQPDFVYPFASTLHRYFNAATNNGSTRATTCNKRTSSTFTWVLESLGKVSSFLLVSVIFASVDFVLLWGFCLPLLVAGLGDTATLIPGETRARRFSLLQGQGMLLGRAVLVILVL